MELVMLLLLLLLLLMKVQTLMTLVVAIGSRVMRKVVRVHRVSHEFLVVRRTAEYFHVRHNVLLLHGQGRWFLAEMIHMAWFDQADVLTR